MATNVQEQVIRGDLGPSTGLKMVQADTSNRCISNLCKGRYLGSIKILCYHYHYANSTG